MDEYILFWLCSKTEFLTIQFGNREGRSKVKECDECDLFVFFFNFSSRGCFGFQSRKCGILSLPDFQGTDFENGWAPSALVVKL